MKRGIKTASRLLFAFYCLVMLWLLFIRGRHPEFLQSYVEVAGARHYEPRALPHRGCLS